MSKEQVILQVLKDTGIYERIKEKVGSDEELAMLFDQGFDELIQLVSK